LLSVADAVGSVVEVGRSRGVVLSFLYWMLRRLLELLVLRVRSQRAKEIEILVLRHQLRVLERVGFATIGLGDLATSGEMQQIHDRLAGVNLIRL
jgi:hypothetical protein